MYFSTICYIYSKLPVYTTKGLFLICLGMYVSKKLLLDIINQNVIIILWHKKNIKFNVKIIEIIVLKLVRSFVYIDTEELDTADA